MAMGASVEERARNLLDWCQRCQQLAGAGSLRQARLGSAFGVTRLRAQELVRVHYKDHRERRRR